MVKKGLPDRWLDYQPLGNSISGTRIIPFKVPLKLELCKRNLEDQTKWFTPAILLENQPKLKTVIDLTNTNRYYNPQDEFSSKGIEHVKIMVEGHGTLPTPDQMYRFFEAMDAHMEKYTDDTEALVGVHCTHGLNRTGYFVCRYLIDRLKLAPDDAIEKFNKARGHPMERQQLINTLKSKMSQIQHQPPRKTYKRHSTSYISPLSSAYDDYSNDYYGFNNSRGTRYDRYHSGTMYNRGRYHYQVSKADLDKNWRARDEDTVHGPNPAKRKRFNDVSEEADADHTHIDVNNGRKTWKDRAKDGEGGRYGHTSKKFDGSKRIPKLNRQEESSKKDEQQNFAKDDF